MATLTYGTPTDGSTSGAAYYGLLSMLGDPFGLITQSDAASYADLCLCGTATGYDWVNPVNPTATVFRQEPRADSQSWLEQLIQDSYYYAGNDYFLVDTCTVEQYNENIKQNSLFGLSFLPWNTCIAKTADGKYAGMHRYGLFALKMLNPLGQQPLMLKLQTIGILTGTAVVLYFGSKYMLRAYRRLA